MDESSVDYREGEGGSRMELDGGVKRTDDSSGAAKLPP